ncbi:MAG: hypothetical protein NT019_02670 [Candidatus Adlerbacteria bacterium]|nr:hypothetical protein [Candidatus Adlerbacteria bacterium]
MQFTPTTTSFKDLVNIIISYINLIVPIVGGLAIIFFFVGLVRYIYYAGDAKGRTAGRDNIIWGLVAMFVIFTLSGILQLLKSALLSP